MYEGRKYDGVWVLRSQELQADAKRVEYGAHLATVDGRLCCEWLVDVDGSECNAEIVAPNHFAALRHAIEYVEQRPRQARVVARRQTAIVRRLRGF